MEHVCTEEDDEVSSSILVYVDSPYTWVKKSSIDGNCYLVYLWELGELPSTFIGGVGGLHLLMRVYTYGTYVVRIRGSSHPCGNIPDVGK